ncbi:uncharacterized protein LOC111258739 isoform X1 [Varroa jacobsoni]|uniref:uncharacterized protein LOC111258739 isoform X1 n=1 Tax=Varroa jacobsoni TaxID=62625 RepID=UPI000BF608A5|nr:uncharacterized protein LOC111258739 isoform X1 [Varroa jacobsoni]
MRADPQPSTAKMLPWNPLMRGLCVIVAFTLANPHIVDAKIYDRCELARELHDRFKFSKRDLDKWLCLAYWESRFDTRAYHKGRFDGSGDHGIFQINDKYWCQPYVGYSENVCKVPCYMLRDDNLEDDIQCVNKIFRRHGFHAWMMFTHKCSGNTLEFFNGCDIKSRKGALPRYEAEASTMSRTYVQPNRSTADEMEPSAYSHEHSEASGESIHSVGGDFSLSTRPSASSGTMATSLGYSPTAIVQSPTAGALYRHASQATLPDAASLHLANPRIVGGTSVNRQNLFLANTQGLASSSFASPLTSSGLGPPLSLATSVFFSNPEMSLLSSPQLLTPQASELTPFVHSQAALQATPAKAKPGVIQRLQGALRPSFRVPFRTSGRSVVPAASAPNSLSLMPAPIISGYGAPILLPLNHLTSRGLGGAVNKRHGASVTKRPHSVISPNTPRSLDPLIAALNAPFPSSGSKHKKSTANQSSGSEEDEDEEDKKKKKKK